MREIGNRGILEENKWNSIYNKKDKKIKNEINRITSNKLPQDFNKHIASLKKKIFNLKPNQASRQASAFVLDFFVAFRLSLDKLDNVLLVPFGRVIGPFGKFPFGRFIGP